MKIRPSILCFIVIVMALIALAIWYGKKRLAATPSAGLTETNLAIGSTGRTVEPSSPSTPANPSVPPVNNFSATNFSTPAVPPTADNPQQGLSALNDVPIIFYGKLEDQFGDPVVGAQISASIRIYNGTQSTVKRLSVISDANGFFQLNEGKGESLGLMPQKDGYTLASTETEFKYSYMYKDHFTPDKNNPTVLKMWKLQGAEPLVGIDQHYKLHYTNAPINFDLLTGQIVPTGGDIKLTVSRSPGIMSGRNRLDWSVQVEAVDGGVMESGGQDAVTFAAPENGYLPSDTLIFSTNAPHKWFGLFNQGFFVMSRNGQVYSKIGLSFRINENQDDFMYVTFSGAASTNGSRNWEATAPQ